MEIKLDKEWRAVQERQTLARPTEKVSTSFQSFVQSNAGKAEASILEGLLLKIDEQGRRVSHFQTARDLNVYKRLIQQFMQKAVSYGLELSQKRSWQHTRGQLQTIVKKVDESLIELTKTVLKDGAKPIEILDRIGEIKGLLINLYR